MSAPGTTLHRRALALCKRNVSEAQAAGPGSAVVAAAEWEQMTTGTLNRPGAMRCCALALKECPMPAALPVYMPWLMTAGFGWLYYRRIRRHFGRQPWQPRRTRVRIVLLALVSVMLGLAAAYVPHVATGMVAGALAGLALGVFALRHTRIDVRDGKPGYTPNPWIGGALSLLLVGRLAWRWYGGAFSQGAAYTTGNASPLTMSLAAALVVYSLVQAVGLTLRMRAQA